MLRLLSDDELWCISTTILKNLSDQLDELNELSKEEKQTPIVQSKLLKLRNMAKQIGDVRWDLVSMRSRRGKKHAFVR